MKYFVIVILICFAMGLCVSVAGLTGYQMGRLDASINYSIYYADGQLDGYKKGIGECANLCSLAFAEWWEETNIKVDVKKVEP